MTILGSAIFEGKKPEINDEIRAAAEEYETALSDLISLQYRHILLTPTLTKDRIMVLYSTLNVFCPDMVIDAIDSSEEDRKEIFDLAKQSKRFVGGVLGETTFEARRDLGIDKKLSKKRSEGSILDMSTDEMTKEVKKYENKIKKNKST